MAARVSGIWHTGSTRCGFSKCIRYHLECFGENKYISNSLILLETSIAKKQLLPILKVNLEKLGYIQRMQETQKGTLYKVEYDTIVSDIKVLNEERNALERLRLADNIRTQRGLESINEAKIKAFAGSSFDTDIQLSNRYEEATEARETATERAAKATPKVTEQTGVTDKATNGIPQSQTMKTVKEISVSETQGKEEMAERIKTLMTRENFIKWINNAIERGENYCIPFAQADIIVDRILNDARKYGHIIEVPRDKRNNYAKIVI